MLTHLFVSEEGTGNEARQGKSNKILIDLFAILPFKEIVVRATGSYSQQYNMFYLAKVVRLYHGFWFLDYKQFIKQLKEI